MEYWVGMVVAEGGGTVPATKADLKLLKANLKLFEAVLGGKIGDVRVEMANMER